MHVTVLSPDAVATGLPHLLFVHVASTVRLVPTNSGQQISGFSHSLNIVLPMSLVWSNKIASCRLLVLPGD